MKKIGSVILGLLISLTAVTGCLQKSETSKDSQINGGSATKIVSAFRVNCVIEFNGRRERIESEVELKSENATAFEALEILAEKNGLAVESSGDGESLFVVAVGDFANDGAGGKNWVYKVDGKLGNCSSGIFKVSPGQQVQWSLGAYP